MGNDLLLLLLLLFLPNQQLQHPKPTTTTITTRISLTAPISPTFWETTTLGTRTLPSCPRTLLYPIRARRSSRVPSSFPTCSRIGNRRHRWKTSRQQPKNCS